MTDPIARAATPEPGGDIEARLQAAIALHRVGKLQEAAQAYRNIIRAGRADLRTLSLYAVLLRQLGKRAESMTLTRELMRLKPPPPAVLTNMGVLALHEGNPDQAEKWLRRAVAADASQVEALANLGLICRRAGNLREAIGLLERALRVGSPQADMANELGAAYMALGESARALDAFSRAVALDPDFPPARASMAQSLAQFGRARESILQFQEALRLTPDNPPVHNNLANLLASIGRFDAAAEHYRLAIGLAPKLVGAYYTLGRLAPFKPGDSQPGALADLAEDQSLQPNERAVAMFALGDYCNSRKQPDMAFELYARGNRLRRRQAPSDMPGQIRILASIKSGCGRAFFDSAPPPQQDEDGPAPVLIVGLPRCGASLLEHMLGAHPQAAAAGECQALAASIESMVAVARPKGENGKPLTYPEALAVLSDEDKAAIRRAYRVRLTAATGQPATSMQCQIDRSLVNFRHLATAHMLLPNVRILHLARDPLDQCLSCFTTLFSLAAPYAYDLQELGAYYVAYRRLMAHWRRMLPPGGMFEICYEDLVCQPEETLRDVAAFCGLGWDDAMLNRQANPRPVPPVDARRVRGPIDAESIGRARNYRRHLEPLRTILDRAGLPV